MMFKTGLVSITFRPLAVRQVAELVKQAGLHGIEWGGDVHCPHGDLAAAREARAITEGEGLTVASYGSYYKCDPEDADSPEFEAVLASAVALGAPIIRVWPGRKSPEDADDAYRARIAGEARRVADLAAAQNIRIGFEYHGGTLTATDDSAQRFLDEVGHSHAVPYWQPPNNRPSAANLEGLKAIADRVPVAHVFHWDYSTGHKDCRPLAEGESAWRDYLAALKAARQECWLLLEFVRGNEPEQFLADAETLTHWINAF